MTPTAEVTATATPAGFAPTPTPTSTPTPLATRTPTPEPAPQPAPQPFILETRPSEVELTNAAGSADSATFFFRVVDGQLLTVSDDEFYRINQSEGGSHVLLDPSRRQPLPLLLVDLRDQTVVELTPATSPADIIWRSATTVELSLPSPARPAQQVRHLLDVETFLATPLRREAQPTHDVEAVVGGEVHITGGSFRPAVSIRASDGTEISSFEGLLHPPTIAPTGTHLAGLTGRAVLVASAPTWEPRVATLDFPFKETGSISWSPGGDSLLVAGSAGVYLIDPTSLDWQRIEAREGEGIGASWALGGTRILVGDVGFGPLDLVDTATLRTIRQYARTRVIAEDPVSAERLLVFGDVCTSDAEAFSLHLIDLTSGDTIRLAPAEAGFWTASWSPDARYIAGSRTRGQLTLVDLTTLEATTVGDRHGVPMNLFPSRFRWTANGWLIFGDIGGRDRCLGP